MKANEATVVTEENATETAVVPSFFPLAVTLTLSELMKFLRVVTLCAVEAELANNLERDLRWKQSGIEIVQ